MTRKGRRLTMIGVGVGALAIAVALVLVALRDNIVFFHTPAEISEKSVEPGSRLRLGGLVKEGSIRRGEDRMVTFTVTDGKRDIEVAYRGLLPDLFREGQGVVADGVLETPALFRASTVLARHDETYMPRELADALKKQGLFQHASPGGAAAAGSGAGQ